MLNVNIKMPVLLSGYLSCFLSFDKMRSLLAFVLVAATILVSESLYVKHCKIVRVPTILRDLKFKKSVIPGNLLMQMLSHQLDQNQNPKDKRVTNWPIVWPKALKHFHDNTEEKDEDYSSNYDLFSFWRM